MSQTFADFDKVPGQLMAKIHLIWRGAGAAASVNKFDHNGDPVTVYQLADYKVAANVDYLTKEQKIAIFDLCADRGAILSNLLHSLSFEIERIRVGNEIYHLPGLVVGTWPHCNLFGGMDETGHLHT